MISLPTFKTSVYCAGICLFMSDGFIKLLSINALNCGSVKPFSNVLSQTIRLFSKDCAILPVALICFVPLSSDIVTSSITPISSRFLRVTKRFLFTRSMLRFVSLTINSKSPLVKNLLFHTTETKSSSKPIFCNLCSSCIYISLIVSFIYSIPM